MDVPSAWLVSLYAKSVHWQNCVRRHLFDPRDSSTRVTCPPDRVYLPPRQGSIRVPSPLFPSPAPTRPARVLVFDIEEVMPWARARRVRVRPGFWFIRVPIKPLAESWHHSWLRSLSHRPSGCSPPSDFQRALTWHGKKSLLANWHVRLSGQAATT